MLDNWERDRKGQGQAAHIKRKTTASSQFCLTKSHCITFEQIKQHTLNTDLTDHITHREIAGNQLHSVVQWESDCFCNTVKILIVKFH